MAEHDVLPMLRKMRSIGDYQRIAIKRDPENYPYYAAADVLCLLADGKLDKAADVLATQERAAGVWVPRLRHLHLDRKLLRKERLSKVDRVKLAALLHERETYTVEKLKLCDIWEPTRFPLESSEGS
ncbi:hypothetical protein [Bauldia litoralis]|uniref:hypothetical protein n=2 Tax=Hyphomicrobiales TaxID=356 RepID=UPI0032662740